MAAPKTMRNRPEQVMQDTIVIERREVVAELLLSDSGSPAVPMAFEECGKHIDALCAAGEGVTAALEFQFSGYTFRASAEPTS